MRKVILFCLLLLVTGCLARKPVSSSDYVIKNLTTTCAYNTLEKMDGITKVWTYYDRLDGWGDDGIGFEGEWFSGRVIIQHPGPSGYVPGNVVVYSEGYYWGFGERPPIIKQINQQIKESLYDSCNE